MATPETTDRRVNLVFAFLATERSGSQTRYPWVPRSWFLEKVKGYGASPTATKRFHEDIKMLKRVGVPIAERGSAINREYRLQGERYELPDIIFTPQEMTVLALAGRAGQAGQLEAFARSGWLKLATGAHVEDHTADEPSPAEQYFSQFNDLSRASAGAVTKIVSALMRNRSITFAYRRSALAASSRRAMDPWGLVPHAGRIYLTGFDLERQDARCFRLPRVSDVELQNPATHPRPTDLLKVVESAFHRSTVDARVRVSEGRAAQLRAAGDVRGDTVWLRDVDRDWLVRTVAGLGDAAQILEPASAKNEVRALLEASL